MVYPVSASSNSPTHAATRHRAFGQADDAMACRAFMFAVAAGLTIAALGFGLALIGGVNASNDPDVAASVQIGPPGR